MQMSEHSNFKYVNDLWNETHAAALAGDEVALLLYRSNLLGADLRLTNYGGGNTSCKVVSPDPLTGEAAEVLWIKGSGGDLGTLKREGLTALYTSRLRSLEQRYTGPDREDDMPDLYLHCRYALHTPAPSIDTPLHAFLPFSHIDHLHPDAAIAIAASRDGRQITQELFEGSVGWVDWQRPGFGLGLKLRQCLAEHPGIRGIMLGGHGLFTWGDTSAACYRNTLEVIEACARCVTSHYGKKGPVFGGQKIISPSPQERLVQAARIAPVLRGLCSSVTHMIGHFTDAPEVLEFINSSNLERLAPLGTSCPDHFLRTKICPLVLPPGPLDELSGGTALRLRLAPLFQAYKEMYTRYYQQCRQEDSPAQRDPGPVIILYPGIGLFSFSRDKQTARVAAEFYINAIQVMKGAEALSAYVPLSRQEAFNIEYWKLEEAKLRSMPLPGPLSGKIALITGSAGGIGKAIARKFIQEGAAVVINDNDRERLEEADREFSSDYGRDAYVAVPLDVTSTQAIDQAFSAAALAFGGIDIVVNCAGLSISKSIETHTDRDWELLYDILVGAQFRVTRRAARMLRSQQLGGDILNIVSKNALVSGPDNAAYGSAKAAQLHLSRLTAAELGADRIRVNVVNPDAVISGSRIWANGWAEGRAKAYGVSIQELPDFYAGRTLLNQVILPEDIANACLAFTGGLLGKTTGNMLNVDGGIAAAFPR